VRNDIIKRIRYTKTQTALNATERMKNVAAAFDLDRPDIVGGRRLLLVDDVLTTGSTLNACAMTLAGANPESISAATIAVA
jgi:predicted amidophosphoribosyltransferase